MHCSNKPHNPLLNSGAIMSAGLLLAKLNPGLPVSSKFDLVNIFLFLFSICIIYPR